MTTRSIWIAIISGLLGLVVGFMVANSLNRSSSKTATDTSTSNSNSNARSELALTEEEMRQKIAEADANPANFGFQKNLGMSLYRYSALKQDPAILPDALRIMERALALEPADRDLQVYIGNAYFDKGFFEKDNSGLERSREFYNKALATKPGDADVRTDLAITYFLHDPADLDTAVKEFEKSLASNPKQERALQFLTQTYIKQNATAKAAATLEKLKKVNPGNTSIAELASMLGGADQGAAK